MFRKHLSKTAPIALLCGLGLPLLAGCAGGGGQWSGNDGALGGALSSAVSGAVPGHAATPPAAANPGAVAPSAVYPAAIAHPNAESRPAAAPPAAPRPVPAPAATAAAAPVPPPASEQPERVAAAIDLPNGSLQQVAAPDWAVGSEWRYSDGYGLKVTHTDGITTTFTRLDDPGQWFTRRGFLREEAQSATTHREAVYRTAGADAGRVLTAGKPLTFRREYMSNGELKVHATSWTVEGTDRITVPAGTFDCAIIVMRTRNLVNGWTGFERWWYSPEAQSYVRMEYRYGDSPVGSRVLMSYRLVNAPAPRIAMAEPAG